MLFSNTTYIGIDPTAGKKPITYAALSSDLDLMALRKGNLDEVLAFLAGQQSAVVAINAPQSPNRGLMKIESNRQRLETPPRPSRWLNYRVAEYILRQHNIHIIPTPSQENKCPQWIRVGFTLYRRCQSFGYKLNDSTGSDLQLFEVYPQASFAVLLGHNPLLKRTFEGRLQRQLILYENKVRVPDPMIFFEEITRHRLMNGIFPDGILLSIEELEAIIAAYNAWCTHHQPQQISFIGDPLEGMILIPCEELKSHY